MKTTALRWLVLLLIPGCLLVQPLDAAKPDDDDTVPSSSAGGPPKAGSSGSTSNAGSGNAGRGGSSSAGAASGGAPSGVDFSLFTGTWTITSGKNTSTCGSSTNTSDIPPGDTDSFGLGTISDLILDPGTACELLVDVDDHTASLNDSTSPCSYSDATFSYDLVFDSYQFVVSSDGKTAQASMAAAVLATDADGNETSCDSDSTWKYKR